MIMLNSKRFQCPIMLRRLKLSRINHNFSQLPDFWSTDNEIWNASQRLGINRAMRIIGSNPYFSKIVKESFIDSETWRRYTNAFRREILKNPLQQLRSQDNVTKLRLLLDELEPVKEFEEVENMNVDVVDIMDTRPAGHCMKFLFNMIMIDADKKLKASITAYKALCTISDLRIPHDWYPYARMIRRRIIYHGGPTNSGKTYHALKRLRETEGTGLYCGPLRLLALEIYERLNREGVYTNLLTGQEKKELPYSTHTSCTLEMVDITKPYNVAVIDEIQMIADENRGYAWTRALHGLRADEIHVCGGLEASSIVKDLVEGCGDIFELKMYQRLSELRVSDESLKGDYSKVQPGDCIVAFSRADIFSIRRQIERLTPYKCAVIYGQLPPETRSTQARLFNDPGTGYDILVASDAIGMGLNLNIRRIIFHNVLKRGAGPTAAYWMDLSSIKQIGGRAGRLSSQYDFGEVTTWQEADLAYVKAAMSMEVPQITSAGIFPSVELIQKFSEQFDEPFRKDLLRPDDISDSLMDNSIDTLIHDSKLSSDVEEFQLVDIPSTTRFEESHVELLTQDGRVSISADSIPSSDTNDFINPYNVIDEFSDVGVRESVLETRRGIISNGDSKRQPFNRITNISDVVSHLKLSSVLEKFVESAQLTGKYFLCEHADMSTISNWLQPIPLSLPDRFLFANAPVNLKDSLAMYILYQFAATYALGRPVALNVRLSRIPPRDVKELSDLCLRHNILDLYLWLSVRFPAYFVERELAMEQKEFAVSLIEQSLDKPNLRQKFSHSEEYMLLRKKIQVTCPDELPPPSFGLLRDYTKRNIEKISTDLFVFPLLQEEVSENERLANILNKPINKSNSDRIVDLSQRNSSSAPKVNRISEQQDGNSSRRKNSPMRNDVSSRNRHERIQNNSGHDKKRDPKLKNEGRKRLRSQSRSN